MLARDCLITEMKKIEPFAIALSGGTDSAALLALAATEGPDIIAVTLNTGMNPAGEINTAGMLAERFGVPHFVISTDMPDVPEIRNNAPDRCYVCKKIMMRRIVEFARNKGYNTLIDGTHADDNPDERPGMQALGELGILSPFRICHMGKKEIKALAEELGVPFMPSSSCLATRFPEGAQITRTGLERIRKAEGLLRGSVTGRLRVRDVGGIAYIEAEPGQHNIIKQFFNELHKLGFQEVRFAQEN